MDYRTLVPRVQRMLAQAQGFVANELPQEAAARARLALSELDAAIRAQGEQPARELLELREIAAERLASYEAVFAGFLAASEQRKAKALEREVFWLKAPLPKKTGVSY